MLGEVDAQVRHQRPVVARPPVAAVNYDDHGMWSGDVREKELADLASIGSVLVE
jgi:hypothetical protein